MYRIKDKVDMGLAFSPTEETQSMFKQHLPDAWCYETFSSAKLEQMMSLQKVLLKENKARSLFLLCDDCAYDKKLFAGTAIRNLYMNGRHMRLTYLNSCQYMMDMPPDLRAQIDYVFCLKQPIISEKVKLHKYFFGHFERFEDFSRTMDACCANYGAIVLDNTVSSNNIEDCVFWYRADINLPPFKMGKPVFHKLARRHTKSERQLQEEAKTRIQQVTEKTVDKRITHVERQIKGKTIEEDKRVMLV